MRWRCGGRRHLSLIHIWPGLVLFGQYAYGANTDDGAISRRCRAFTGLPLEGYRALEELDLLPGCERPNTKIRNPSKYLLYQDLLLGCLLYTSRCVEETDAWYSTWENKATYNTVK